MAKGGGQAERMVIELGDNPKASIDPLGDRMKNYEHATRTFLPKKSICLLRLDGRSFHSWVKGRDPLEHPYDLRLNKAMADTTRALCEEISVSIIGYCQSLFMGSVHVH